MMWITAMRLFGMEQAGTELDLKAADQAIQLAG
ncbi:hypothetical protein SAMN05720606_11918 [Paenibacillus polysaccharolyticus]|uniref:Uncharacterized protein n=1 Tax=Paenibacillus polysaccharolyticus TaxID=582692 RepID=A0A1G5L1Z9_9BACL|nr:hypothetical protein SAMN05720606_11918 [Paenibacillus polysaccharolyticus]